MEPGGKKTTPGNGGRRVGVGLSAGVLTAEQADLEAALQTTELQLLVGKYIRTLRHVALTQLAEALSLYTQHSDLLLAGIEDYRTLIAPQGLQSRLHAPMLILGPDRLVRTRVVLPANAVLLKCILPLKKYLWREAEVIVLATEESKADEKMLMAYVQGHCSRPGYMFLKPESDQQLLGVLTRDTVLVSALQPQDHPSRHLLDFALANFSSMNLSIVLG